MTNTNLTQAGSSNFFSVDPSLDEQTIVERNDNREGLLMFNDSEQTVLISFTGNIAEDEFTLKIAPGGYYESGTSVYAGSVQALWLEEGAGKLLVTELEV